MDLPDFRSGAEFTADDLNRLLAAVEAAERRVRGLSQGGRGAVCTDADEVRVYPWEVRDDGDRFLVRPGRVVVGFGTDFARARLETGPVRHYAHPWADREWVEVPKGGQRGGVVYLVVTSLYLHRERHAMRPWSTYWGGDAYSERGHEYALTVSPLAGGGSGARRLLPLAAWNDDEEELTQLAWGDLDIFEVSALLDREGKVLPPEAGLPDGWGEGCRHELCDLEFRTGSEDAGGVLRGCLDEMGGVEFFCGRLRGWRDVPGSYPPEEPGWDVPVPDRDDGEDDPGGGRRRRRRRKRKKTDPDGYWYEGGHGVSVQVVKRKTGDRLAYDFLVSATAELVATRDLFYTAQVDFTVSNSMGRYDWPWYGQYDLQMYYGVTASGVGLSVQWRSSFLGADTLAKSARVEGGLPVVHGSCAPLLDGHFGMDSETAPGDLGNIIVAVPAGWVTRAGVVKEMDPLTGGWVRVRHTRRFRRYRLALNERKLLEIAENKIIAHAPTELQVSPAVLSGHSDGIDGPDVRVAAASAWQSERAQGDTEVTGPLAVSWGLEYTSARMTIPVSGSGAWNSEGAAGPQRFGEISGSFVCELPAAEFYVD